MKTGLQVRHDIAGLIMPVLLAPLLLGGGRSAYADGGFFPSASQLEKRLITEPEQKAIILFDSGTENLIISPSFRGTSDRFAWVVPVPSRPRVRVMNGAVFHELKDRVAKHPLGWNRQSTAPGAAASRVEVLERRSVGAYDVSVLRSDDPNALTRWLKQNGYQLPQTDSYPLNGFRPVEYYVRHKWVFVACRVRTGQKANGLKTGTLAPLRLTFHARRPIYPLRLSAFNGRSFHVNLTLLMPSDDFPWPGDDLRPVEPLNIDPIGVMLANGSIAGGQAKYPTLARLSSRTLRVYGLTQMISPYDCSTDLIWPASRDEAQRMERRYANYASLVRQEWLKHHPAARQRYPGR